MASSSFLPPGLIAGPADFARLREDIKSPGLLRDLAGFVRRLADHELTEPAATREMEGRRLLAVSRTVLRRVIHCGIVYQLDRDERHARRAIQDLQAAASFSDWNPSHFLDVGELCCAFALGLDWLHEALHPAERAGLEDALVRLGLMPGLADAHSWFVTATNNWNAVCNGGLAMGALAVRHRYPDLAGKLVERCIKQLPLHGENYAPEGAFIEGPIYWAYGTNFHVLAVESLLRATGSTHGLDRLPGFRESAAYMAHMAGPAGGFYSYFDARPERIPLPALFWFGRHFGDSAATRVEAEAVSRAIKGPLEPILWTENRCFALSLLWLNPAHLGDDSPLPAAWSGGGANPVALWRDAWSPDAVWVGTKGGRATLSHGHIDAGSFVLEAGGVRWAVDPGMEEYHRLESMGVNLWGADRWNVFRLGAEAHSLPRIDGERPRPEGDCPRIRWSPTPLPSATFDLTGLYPSALARLHRTCSAGGGGQTAWIDEVSGLAAGRVYRFTWLTMAEVEVGPAGVVLSQGGRKLGIRVGSSLPFSIRVLDHAALLKPIDTPTPEIKRIEFAVVSTGADFDLRVTARLV